jgi:dipeptidyl aminopeptidase/acylaminoacyl peptidase
MLARARRLATATAVAVAVTLATALTAGAEPAYRNPTPGAEIALQIPGMHRAVVRRDVVYARDGRRTLRLDVYRPAGSDPRGRLPGVLLVHGSTGDPSPKDWGIYVG